VRTGSVVVIEGRWSWTVEVMKIGLSESSVDGFHRLEFSSLLSLVNFHASGVGELVVGFKRSETMSKEVSIMAAHQETSRADAITKFGKRQLTSLEEKYFQNCSNR
jgi:hypothetical protein